MADIITFLNKNNITKKRFAEYIGVSPQFVTQLCNGKRALPSKKYELILQNAFGWDTAALVPEEGECPPLCPEESSAKLTAREENKMLNMRIKVLEQQLADALADKNEYWNIIKEKLLK